MIYRTIVDFHLKPEAVDTLKEMLVESTPLTLAEPGCISAGMYQDCNDPTHFYCMEDWKSYEDMMGHLENKPEIPDPRDAGPFIEANCVGEPKFTFVKTFVAMRNDDKEA